MKKVLSFVLALVMVMALSVTAFAEDKTNVYNGAPTPPKSETQNVTADFTPADLKEGAKTYHFTITWAFDANNNLSYTGAKATYTWDTANLKYVPNEGATDAKWEGSAKVNVSVSNRSNAALTVSTEVTKNEYNLKATTTDSTPQTAKSAADGIVYTNTTATGNPGSASFSYTFSPQTDSKDINDTVADATKVVAELSITVKQA